jgi:hypothetical protein
MLTRREAAILLFGLTVFILSFNTHSPATAIVHSNPSAPNSPGPTPANALLHDGQRTDEIEREILGVDVGDADADADGINSTTSTRRRKHDLDLGPFGITQDQQHVTWDIDMGSGRVRVPVSRVLAHVPGECVHYVWCVWDLRMDGMSGC